MRTDHPEEQNSVPNSQVCPACPFNAHPACGEGSCTCVCNAGFQVVRLFLKSFGFRELTVVHCRRLTAPVSP